jgi:hypothetical protein
MSPQPTIEQFARDPNVLATLCSLASLTTNRCTEEIDFQHGRTREQRTNEVLDSIAKILVAQPSNEVFAVAFKHDPEIMNIYIAGSAPVPAATIGHLHRLWDQLGVMSDMCAEYHTNPESIQRLKASQDIRRLRMSFMRDVYIFSWAKMDKRFQKWVPKLTGFIQLLNQAIQANPQDGNNKLVSLLEDALSGIFFCKESLRRLVDLSKADPLSCETEWDFLVSDLRDATLAAASLLKDDIQCERWAYKVNEDGTSNV